MEISIGVAVRRLARRGAGGRGRTGGDPSALPQKLMRAYRIGPAIGNVRNEGAELIDPIAA
jgi:hypothetical protein